MTPITPELLAEIKRLDKSTKLSSVDEMRNLACRYLPALARRVEEVTEERDIALGTLTVRANDIRMLEEQRDRWYAQALLRAGIEDKLRAAEQQRDALAKALEAIKALEPEPFNFPDDWQKQIDACPECTRYAGHPIQQGICDLHRKPLYARQRHDDHEREAIGYRAKQIASAAVASLTPKEPT